MTLIGISATFYNRSKYEFGRHKRIKEKIKSQISIYQKKRLTDPSKIMTSNLNEFISSPPPFIIFLDINPADIKGSRSKSSGLKSSLFFVIFPNIDLVDTRRFKRMKFKF